MSVAILVEVEGDTYTVTAPPEMGLDEVAKILRTAAMAVEPVRMH